MACWQSRMREDTRTHEDTGKKNTFKDKICCSWTKTFENTNTKPKVCTNLNSVFWRKFVFEPEGFPSYFSENFDPKIQNLQPRLLVFLLATSAGCETICSTHWFPPKKCCLVVLLFCFFSVGKPTICLTPGQNPHFFWLQLLSEPMFQKTTLVCLCPTNGSFCLGAGEYLAKQCCHLR